MLNRKRTPGDDCALLSSSCIIVNNDLHGTAKETTLARELSNTPCSGDNLIKKRFLQMFQQKEKCHLLGQRKFQYNRYQKVHHQSTNIHTTCCNSHSQGHNKNSSPHKMLKNNVNLVCNSQKSCQHKSSCQQEKEMAHQKVSESQSSHSSSIPTATATSASIHHHDRSSGLKFSCCSSNSSGSDSWAKITRTEEVQLRNAQWYQPGLSRYFQYNSYTFKVNYNKYCYVMQLLDCDYY